MARGLRLEERVVAVLKKFYPNVKRCGLFLNPGYPAFGASPDAINETTVFEIKCPLKEDNLKYYVNEDGEIQQKTVLGQHTLLKHCFTSSWSILNEMEPYTPVFELTTFGLRVQPPPAIPPEYAWFAFSPPPENRWPNPGAAPGHTSGETLAGE
ncbi:conserved hypothetical protein [Culex quinquefasciatus]|uniref:YqaJ viral recombinase domain-containing protein n=1 Tax=Culex quinquefasciatus TaxID=7176 RepID=B0X5Q5_CULQU|nr:conserved hypothetical protein [Culex quinquefasciatus]|eukprot:XP_001864977.1 conserved hypothetical protein [Culex quinquefasciatus]